MLGLLGLIPGWLKLAGIVAAGIALGIVVALIRKSGADAARVEGMVVQLDNVAKRQQAEIAVARATTAEKQKLRDKWSRD